MLKSLTAFRIDPLITDIQNIYAELISSRSVTFYWCPGHANMFGNECADRFAKLAIKHGRESTSLIKLPISHAKQVLKQHTLLLWQKFWDTSSNGTLTYKFIPNIRRNPIAISTYIIHTYRIKRGGGSGCPPPLPDNF